MLLKISLGLAILVGLATLFFVHVQVGGKIDTLKSDLATETTAKNSAIEAQTKAQDDAKKAKQAFETSSKELNMATNLLTEVSKNLEEQRKRANTSQAALATATEERNEARQELNKWSVLALPPERVMAELAAKRGLETERLVLLDEKKIFSQKISSLQKRLDFYEPQGSDPLVPPGTKGKVVAYDPKYEFVVLDIGSEQGVVENAKMLINREGKLVTKVKITHVEKNRSIANIMPEWKQDDVLEGDLAIALN